MSEPTDVQAAAFREVTDADWVNDERRQTLLTAGELTRWEPDDPTPAQAQAPEQWEAEGWDIEGLPDLATPLGLSAGTAFRAYGRTGLAVVVPERIGLERQLDGSPTLLVTLVRGGAAPDAAAGGRLEIGFAVDADLGAIGEAAAAAGLTMRLVVAEVEGGAAQVNVRLGPIADVLVPAFDVPPEVLVRARVSVQLSPAAATLVERLVQAAQVPVDLDLRLRVRAVAARLPLALELDPRRIAVKLAERYGEEAVITLTELSDGLEALLPDPDITLTGDPSAIDPPVLRSTIAQRLEDRLTVPETAATATYRLRPLADVAQGSERVDLAVPTAVRFDHVLHYDPFLDARAESDGKLDRYVRRIELPALPTGHIRVTLAANIPEPAVGLLALFADLRVPSTPPLRPQPVMASAALRLPGRVGAVDILLAADEQLAGEVRLRALLDRPGGPIELSGPWRAATGPHQLLGPELFPLPLTLVRATPALIELATVDVLGASGALLAHLDAARPSAAVPRAAQDAAIRLAVRPRGPGRTIELPLDTRRRVDVDPTTLPGFGAHNALVTKTAADGSSVAVEWRAEGAEDTTARSVRLGPDTQTAGIGWIATSPLQPGVVWRIVRDGGAGRWSAPVPPADGLVIAVGATTIGGDDVDANETDPDKLDFVVVEGIELRPDPLDASVWTYLPPGPLLERGPDGAPAITLIEAGAVSFLQLTSRVDLPEDDRARILTGLRQQRPHGPTSIRPQSVIVRRVALQVKPKDGDWVTVTEGTSSGIPPWTTALSATLTAEQALAVKAAINGTPERLRLIGELTVPADAAVEADRATSASLTFTTSAGSIDLGLETRSTQVAAGTDRTLTHVTDIADLFPSN